MAERSSGLWLRLSLRDVRRRWLLVVVIATIIALGTGTYAGLGSTAAWRRESNDESFALLHMHDLRVTLAQGATVGQGDFEAAVRSIPHASWVASTEERLIGPTEVDASTARAAVLVPGQLVGVDVSEPLSVDSLHASAGRSLTASDAHENVALLESQFAGFYELPATGRLTVSGGQVLDYAGLGTSPEYFLVSSRTAVVFAHANLAVLFVPLETAQRLIDQPGQVNEVVLTIVPGGDRSTVEREITTVLAGGSLGGGGEGATITVREDEPAWRMLYNDIDNDQQFWNIIAGLILVGATFAAFSLVTRIVESQRREIGIGMALGVSPRRLAIRPLLVGAEIAVLGVLAGLGIGLLLDMVLASVFKSVLPLPVFHTPFQPSVFARAALIGFMLPFVATAIPVWRAVRVQPVDAIRTGHLATRGGRARLRWLRLPGRSYRRMPLRNLVRAPRRTLLTAAAIGAAITTLIAIIGMVDSFVHTIDAADAEASRGVPNRMQVELDTFYPERSPEVAGIAGAPEVGTLATGLRLFGTVRHEDAEIDVITDLIDFEHAGWTPTLESGTRAAVIEGGIVLSRKAADDIGVEVGDTVTFHHPERTGVTYRMIDSEIEVAAIQPSPTRFSAFFDIGRAELFNMTGITNLIEVTPAPGVTETQLQRAVFGLRGVGSVQSVTATTRLFRDALEDFFGVLRVAELIVLVLALLIAFNSSSISMDERAREHATMLAFGLRPRTVLAMTMIETLLVGALGTALGMVAGRAVLRWTTTSQLDKTVPDIGVTPYVSPATLLTAVAVGVIAVALAPVLTSRRVRRLDIPATLRVVE